MNHKILRCHITVRWGGEEREDAEETPPLSAVLLMATSAQSLHKHTDLEEDAGLRLQRPSGLEEAHRGRTEVAFMNHMAPEQPA